MNPDGCSNCRRRAAILGATALIVGAGLSILVYVKVLHR